MAKNPVTPGKNWQASALLLVLLVVAGSLPAQQRYSLSVLGSYTVPNSSEWNYIRGFGYGVDASWWIEKHWLTEDSAKLVRRPYNAGVRFNFTYFHNGIAGNRFGFIGFLQEPLPYVHHLYLDMGFNAAVYTNPYRRSHDSQNVFIGSFFNCLIQLGLTYKIEFAEKSAMTLSAKYVHSSNGYLYKPNKGLNYLQAELGYDFGVGPRQKTPVIPDAFDSSIDSTGFRNQYWFFSIAPGIVRPRLTEVADRYYYTYTARLGWQYNFNRVRAVGVTLDITNNGSHDSIRVAEHDPYKLPFNVALCANYETWFNHVSLHVGMAAYLLRNAQVYSWFYERAGVYYHFGGDGRRVRHFVGISLKSHAAHIDFIEWNYGIRLRSRSRK